MAEIDEAQESPALTSAAEVVQPSDERALTAWSAAAAALFAVGATSTLVQIVTALALGTAQYFDWRWSTGGLVAIAAAIFMWFKGTSWASWRRRIWPWLLAVGVVAAGSMFVQSPSIAADRDLPGSPSFGLASYWTKVDAAAQYEIVQQPTGKVLVDYSGIKACHLGQPWHACIDVVISEYQFACVGIELSASTPVYVYEHHNGSTLDVCEATLHDIQDMQQQGGSGYIVTSLGAEKLLVTEETRPIRVVKEPARTHVAVCYLGFVGECR